MEYLNVVISVFAQYVLGNEALASLLTLGFSLPALVFGIITPALTKKFDKFHIYITCLAIFAATSIVQYFVGYSNFSMVIMFNVLRGIGYAGIQTLSFMFVPDCIEYGQYKTGIRNEGISFSLQTFANKLYAALTISLSAFVMSSLGFNASNVTSEGMNGVWFTLTLFSALGSIVAIPLMLIFYKLRDKDVKLLIQCNIGNISKEECESKLSKI